MQASQFEVGFGGPEIGGEMNFNEKIWSNLFVRLLIGFGLIFFGLLWYPNKFSIAISFSGAVIVVFARVEAFRRGNFAEGEWRKRKAKKEIE
jgi:hypothetical protein